MSRNKLVMVVGPSGSGKTTLQNQFCSNYGFSRVISCTTRKQRVGEIEGVDYFFKDVKQFEKMISEDKIVEFVKFNNNYYGLLKGEIDRHRDGGFIIVEPNGVKKISEYAFNRGFDVIKVYLDIPDEVRALRMRKRGDSEDLIQNRLKGDCISECSKKLGLRYDLVLDGQKPIEQSVFALQSYLRVQRQREYLERG